MNSGSINAPNGTVGLGAGQEVLLKDMSVGGGRMAVRYGKGSALSFTSTGGGYSLTSVGVAPSGLVGNMVGTLVANLGGGKHAITFDPCREGQPARRSHRFQLELHRGLPHPRKLCR